MKSRFAQLAAIAGFVSLLTGIQPAEAITVAGINFDDNAFADRLLSSFSTNDGEPVAGLIFGPIGAPGVANNPANLEEELIGPTLGTVAVRSTPFPTCNSASQITASSMVREPTLRSSKSASLTVARLPSRWLRA